MQAVLYRMEQIFTVQKMRGVIGKVVAILKRHGAKKASLFGSFARGEQGAKSDLDILVRFGEAKSLFELAGIEREIMRETGRPVDLLTEKSVNPRLAPFIRRDLKVLFK